VTAAARRDVGEDLAAEAGHEMREGLRLSTDRGRLGRAQFMVVLDGSILNIAACAGGIKVERQHPAGTRGGVINGHR
jgi:hypothetical protein